MPDNGSALEGESGSGRSWLGEGEVAVGAPGEEKDIARAESRRECGEELVRVRVSGREVGDAVVLRMGLCWTNVCVGEA